jgi:hypothetical protein
LAVAAALFIWILSADRAQGWAVAADGRKVRIAKVTYGTDHRFTEGKPWVRLLKPLLGNAWAARRGCYEVRFTNATPVLMVWTHWDNMYDGSQRPAEATISDGHGTESELVLNRWNAQAWYNRPDDPRQSQAYVAWLFKNYPRQSDTLHLRIFDRDKRMAPNPAVRVTFQNPVRSKASPSSGKIPPLSVTNTGVEFILRNVSEISNALWRFDFLVRTNGQPDPCWRIARLTASTPAGNILATRSNIAPGAADPLTFELRGALWPDEPAWRFTVDFCRASDFEPFELWRANDVPVPPRGSPFQLSTNLGAASSKFEFRLESIPQSAPFSRLRRNANLFCQFYSESEQILLVRAADEQGREAKVEPGHVTPDGLRNFGLLIPRDAQTLDFTFAIRRSRVVTFDIRADPRSQE